MILCRNILFVFCLVMIASGCYENEPVPTAAFTFSGDNEFKAPCNVKFTNQSTNAFSYTWYFGDDSTSADTNPAHRYVAVRKYLVELRAYTQSRREWASWREVITIRDTVE